MPSKSDQRILEDVLSLPTAPFAERHVLDYLDAFCEGNEHLQVKTDKVGNRLIHFKRRRAQAGRPVCLTAHLDHPGFVVEKNLPKGQVRAAWRGGVKPEYFQGSAVRFYNDATGKWTKGRICKVHTKGRGGDAKVEWVNVSVSRKLEPGTIGMWDVPDPRIRNGRIYARATDDLAGAAAMLCAIDHLRRKSDPVDAYFLFTRAEEVGFIGAIAAAKQRTIPKKCVVVAVENSSELVNARMGDGPILRVGDRSSIFTPVVTAHCKNVADRLVKGRGDFTYQRRLMDGGSCESTAYCELGYDATGVCLALGNYHNMVVKQRSIGPEYIDLSDFDHLVRWFVELCLPGGRFMGADEVMVKRLAGLEKEYRSLLARTVKGEGL